MFFGNKYKNHSYILIWTSYEYKRRICMKFFKKHKLLSFAVITFFVLAGANFYLIYEIVSIATKIIST